MPQLMKHANGDLAKSIEEMQGLSDAEPAMLRDENFQLPPELSLYQFVDFSDREYFELAYSKLITALVG